MPVRCGQQNKLLLGQFGGGKSGLYALLCIILGVHIWSVRGTYSEIPQEENGRTMTFFSWNFVISAHQYRQPFWDLQQRSQYLQTDGLFFYKMTKLGDGGSTIPHYAASLTRHDLSRRIYGLAHQRRSKRLGNEYQAMVDPGARK